MKRFLFVAGMAATIGFTACDDVDVSVLEDHQGAYILNKGTANSSISYYNYEDEKCINNYYQDKNGSTIGAGANSMSVRKSSDFPNGIAFVTLPGANSIEMINMEGFVNAGEISAFTNPTDLLPSEETVVYVSHDEGVTSYDFKSNSEGKTLEVADKPQKLISSGKYLYAACAGDGTGAKVFVIDMSNDVKVDTVDLAYDNPIDMVVDIDRKVWVFCDGAEQALVKLDREFVTETLDQGGENERDTTYLTNQPINFPLDAKVANSANPLTISRDGRILYYVYDKLYAKSVYIEEGEDMTPEGQNLISGDYSNEAFNGIDWDPRTNRIMALTSGGELVVLKNVDDVWNAEEVYTVGEDPIMSVFNF
ncbi:YncE family protein [Carboxylicivirga sp. RSCT41]|uniref:YncE family protein n=1 Tax=Carboxylicivirga agarovorans TaxID=3417570 RepID=UPI003D34C1DF